MEKARAGERRDRSGEGGDDVLLAEKLGRRRAVRFQARLSNFAHYAVAGVKTQAFVRFLF